MKVLSQNEQELGILVTELTQSFFLLFGFRNWLQQLKFFVLSDWYRYDIQNFVVYWEFLNELKSLLSLFILVFFTKRELNQFFFIIHEFIVDSEDPDGVWLSKDNVLFYFELWLINSWVYLILVLLNWVLILWKFLNCEISYDAFLNRAGLLNCR